MHIKDRRNPAGGPRGAGATNSWSRGTSNYGGTFLSGEKTVLRHAEPMAGSEDLLDLAAIQTITNGGMVYMMEKSALPDESLIAAIFRY